MVERCRNTYRCFSSDVVIRSTRAFLAALCSAERRLALRSPTSARGILIALLASSVFNCIRISATIRPCLLARLLGISDKGTIPKVGRVRGISLSRITSSQLVSSETRWYPKRITDVLRVSWHHNYRIYGLCEATKRQTYCTKYSLVFHIQEHQNRYGAPAGKRPTL